MEPRVSLVVQAIAMQPATFIEDARIARHHALNRQPTISHKSDEWPLVEQLVLAQQVQILGPGSPVPVETAESFGTGPVNMHRKAHRLLAQSGFRMLEAMPRQRLTSAWRPSTSRPTGTCRRLGRVLITSMNRQRVRDDSASLCPTGRPLVSIVRTGASRAAQEEGTRTRLLAS